MESFFHELSFHIFRCDVDHPSLHTHDFLELAYVTQGSAIHTVGSIEGEHRQVRITQGDCFLIDRGTEHGYESESGEPVSLINCLFLPAFIDAALTGCDSLEKLMRHYLIRMRLDSTCIPPHGLLFHDESGMFGARLTEMLAEYTEKPPGYAELLRADLIGVLILAARAISHEEEGGSAIAQAQQYIRMHAGEPLTLGALAAQIGYSPSHLSQKFKNETGMTFTAYLRAVRMEQACRLLSSTENRITDIAEQVGYRDMEAFQAAFRAYSGMTARQWRRLPR